MNNQQQLKTTNDLWLEEDQRWQKDILDRQYETQKLVALLYMLEKALPEHSSKLAIHKARIDKHQEDLMHHRCGLEEQCPSACPSLIELETQNLMHQIMAQNHEEMQSEHEAFSEAYLDKMQRFRELAERLMDELEDFR